MFLTTHTSASLIIGALIANPLAAFVLAFIFHLFLDIIPHEPKLINDFDDWFKKIKKYILIACIDFIIIIIMLGVLWYYKKISFSSAMIWAIIGGILPDVLWGINDLFKKKIKILNIYSKFHNIFLHKIIYKKIYLPTHFAFLIQIIFLIIFLVIYLRIV